MMLSKNFGLSELIRTSAPYENYPQVKERIALKQLVDNVLQPLRELYGKPITINSGFRSPMVNKHVGGVPTSQHTKGEAVDITAGSPEENKILFDLIRSNLRVDQCIDEYDYKWLHVSYKTQGNRNEFARITKKGFFRL
jgi:hypothetical protein